MAVGVALFARFAVLVVLAASGFARAANPNTVRVAILSKVGVPGTVVRRRPSTVELTFQPLLYGGLKYSRVLHDLKGIVGKNRQVV